MSKFLLVEINKVRYDHGLPALKLDACLTKEAQDHSDTMAKRKSLNHNGWVQRLKICQQSNGSENVAWGQRDAKECVDSWMKSSGHRENILGNWQVCGIGEKNRYWTALFA